MNRRELLLAALGTAAVHVLGVDPAESDADNTAVHVVRPPWHPWTVQAFESEPYGIIFGGLASRVRRRGVFVQPRPSDETDVGMEVKKLLTHLFAPWPGMIRKRMHVESQYIGDPQTPVWRVAITTVDEKHDFEELHAAVRLLPRPE